MGTCRVFLSQRERPGAGGEGGDGPPVGPFGEGGASHSGTPAVAGGAGRRRPRPGLHPRWQGARVGGRQRRGESVGLATASARAAAEGTSWPSSVAGLLPR